MPSEITARVQRHREKRGIIRVEVEVTNLEDAAAVRRFAHASRARSKLSPEALATPLPEAAEPLESLITRLSPDVLPALHRFASGLALTRSPTLTGRAKRVAENFFDVALAQSQAVEIK